MPDGDDESASLERLLARFDSVDLLQRVTQRVQSQVQVLHAENALLQSELHSLKCCAPVPPVMPKPAQGDFEPMSLAVSRDGATDDDDLPLVPTSSPGCHLLQGIVLEEDPLQADGLGASDVLAVALVPAAAGSANGATAGDAAQSGEKVRLATESAGKDSQRSPTSPKRAAHGHKLFGRSSVRNAVEALHGTWNKTVQNHHDDQPNGQQDEDEHEEEYLGGLVPDLSQLKTGVRRSILRGTDVMDFYHSSGICRKMVTSQAFEGVATVVIACNAIWIAVDVDVNAKKSLADKHLAFIVGEIAFYIYFVFEWIIRLGALVSKLDFVKDNWLIFDTTMVFLSTIDLGVPMVSIIAGEDSSGSKTSMLRLLRLAKLTKMVRIARLLRHLPELTVLIKGLFIAARSVMSTGGLMVGIVYVFAIALRQLSHGTPVGTQYFRSVPHGMKTLLLISTLPDQTELVDMLGDENLLCGGLAILYFVVSTLTLLNMLIGVVCEVITVVSAVEREAMQVNFVKKAVVHAFGEAGIGLQELVTQEKLHDLLLKPSAVKSIKSAGVDPVGLVDFSDYIFRGEFKNVSAAGLTLEQLIEVFLDLGGRNSATVKDIIDARKMLVERMEHMSDTLEQHMSRASNLMLLMNGNVARLTSGKDSCFHEGSNVQRREGTAGPAMPGSPRDDPVRSDGDQVEI